MVMISVKVAKIYLEKGFNEEGWCDWADFRFYKPLSFWHETWQLNTMEIRILMASNARA